jgi:hypothetical protein
MRKAIANDKRLRAKKVVLAYGTLRERSLFIDSLLRRSMSPSAQYCSDKQGRLALQGRQNSTPASISPPAQEQLASTKKFQNLRSIAPPPQGERSSPQGYPSFSIVAERVKGYAKLLGGLRQLPFFGVTAIAQVSKRTEVRQQFSDRSTQGS